LIEAHGDGGASAVGALLTTDEEKAVGVHARNEGLLSVPLGS